MAVVLAMHDVTYEARKRCASTGGPISIALPVGAKGITRRLRSNTLLAEVRRRVLTNPAEDWFECHRCGCPCSIGREVGAGTLIRCPMSRKGFGFKCDVRCTAKTWRSFTSIPPKDAARLTHLVQTVFRDRWKRIGFPNNVDDQLSCRMLLECKQKVADLLIADHANEEATASL